jgi:hypothetical protein
VERGHDVAVRAVSIIRRDTHHLARGTAVDGYRAIDLA